MNIVSKLLIASTLAVSFATPVFASTSFSTDPGTEGATVAERNVYTNPRQAVWSDAYAMESNNAPSANWGRASTMHRDYGISND